MKCACSGCLPLEGGFGRKITPAKPLIAITRRTVMGPRAKPAGTVLISLECRQETADFSKCRAYDGGRGSNSSDWRKRWEACGNFRESK